MVEVVQLLYDVVNFLCCKFDVFSVCVSRLVFRDGAEGYLDFGSAWLNLLLDVSVDGEILHRVYPFVCVCVCLGGTTYYRIICLD